MSLAGRSAKLGIFPTGKHLHSTQSGLVLAHTSPAVITTASALTYSTTEFLGGLIQRDPNGAARIDTTPTATDVITSLDNPPTGNSFLLYIDNQADAAETITLAAGTGFTLDETLTIAQNECGLFLCRIISLTTITMYSLGALTN